MSSHRLCLNQRKKVPFPKMTRKLSDQSNIELKTAAVPSSVAVVNPRRPSAISIISQTIDGELLHPRCSVSDRSDLSVTDSQINSNQTKPTTPGLQSSGSAKSGKRRRTLTASFLRRKRTEYEGMQPAGGHIGCLIY